MLAPHDATNATVIASAMRSIMPGVRDRTSLAAPTRKGRPPQANITVPRIGEIHDTAPESGTS